MVPRIAAPVRAAPVACPRFKSGEVELRAVPGSHRFKGEYQAVVDAVTDPHAPPS